MLAIGVHVSDETPESIGLLLRLITAYQATTGFILRQEDVSGEDLLFTTTGTRDSSKVVLGEPAHQAFIKMVIIVDELRGLRGDAGCGI